MISADEYRQAVMAQRDCVEEAGYETTPIVAAGSLLTFDATADYSDAADPEEEDRQFLATMQECSDEYVKFVGYAWSSSQVVADGPERDQMRREMAQCVTDAGVDMELDVTEQDLLPALEAALGGASQEERQLIQDCVSEFGDLFLAEPDR
ncbi:hypothetical protein [Cellulomonas carbonis]|uniref:hypothetical protein n=1 Tax=Cellulomonas carbonis TaxID=1386092 RepID=UPI00126996BB|nr:hypothetical protein [Cellulomonas carbonis]MDT0164189.1 hypothetical protein [Actinotalea sp. AC32]